MFYDCSLFTGFIISVVSFLITLYITMVLFRQLMYPRTVVILCRSRIYIGTNSDEFEILVCSVVCPFRTIKDERHSL